MKVLHSVMCSVQAMMILMFCCLFWLLQYSGTRFFRPSFKYFFIIFLYPENPFLEYSLQSPLNRLFAVLLGSCNSAVLLKCCFSLLFTISFIVLFYFLFFYSIFWYFSFLSFYSISFFFSAQFCLLTFYSLYVSRFLSLSFSSDSLTSQPHQWNNKREVYHDFLLSCDLAPPPPPLQKKYRRTCTCPIEKSKGMKEGRGSHCCCISWGGEGDSYNSKNESGPRLILWYYIPRRLIPFFIHVMVLYASSSLAVPPLLFVLQAVLLACCLIASPWIS